jgi:single-strand DNA-binding protein
VALEDAHIETFQKQGGGEGVKLAARITAIDLAGSGQQAAPQPQQRQQPQRQAPQQRTQQVPAGGGFDDMHDDVPF